MRRETNPDDLEGTIAATGILTSRGGKQRRMPPSSRAAWARPAVCGAESLSVDTKGRVITTDAGRVFKEGDVLSIDGSTGKVYAGEVPVVESAIVQYFERGVDAALAEARDDQATTGGHRAVDRIMSHADAACRLRVRANADTPEDADPRAPDGSPGHRLVRTEQHVPR